MKEPFPCFSCGKPMIMMNASGGYCATCEVVEVRKPAWNHTVAVTGQLWDGGSLEYLDHGQGAYPHP